MIDRSGRSPPRPARPGRIRRAAWTAACAWAALCGPACTRGGGEAPPPRLPSGELDDLPAEAAVLVRIDLSASRAPVVAAAVADAIRGRSECIDGLLHSVERVTVALVPRDRDFAGIMRIEGVTTEEAVRKCAGALAQSLAMHPPAPGSSPVVVPLDPLPGESTARYLVALDRKTERERRGLRGPVAAMLAALADHPIAVVVAGGNALRSLSGHAATYLPLSSMGDAADRIVVLGYGIAPQAAGGARVHFEARLADAGAAEALARQIANVGRIVALQGDDTAWAPFRGRVRGLAARIAGDDGRTVAADGFLTEEGLRDLLR